MSIETDVLVVKKFSNQLIPYIAFSQSTVSKSFLAPIYKNHIYIFVYNNACHLCRSGPGQTSKKCIEKVQCTDSVDFKKFLPPEHPFSWSNKEQGHFSPCRLIILLVCCSMSIETDVLVVKKNWNQPSPYIAFFQYTFSNSFLAPIYKNQIFLAI